LTIEPQMPASGPPGFHLLAKPSGSTCNIDCTYCFFLSKEALYPNEKSRMSAATLEAYIRQLLESHRVSQVTVAWQGGEPTLMKLEFFRHAVELVEKYRRPDQQVQHTFQTNGLLLETNGARSSSSMASWSDSASMARRPCMTPIASIGAARAPFTW
jgi:uncharacterized protein